MPAHEEDYNDRGRMDDTVYRQQAIDALMAEPLKWDDSSVWKSARCHQWMMDMDVIKALPSAQPEQRWISSGKKPLKEGNYLVWMPFAPPKHRMAVAEYCGGYWNIKTPISAWMPLPEPYNAERRTDG